MDSLTRIDPNGENDRYPLQKQEIAANRPLGKEVNKAWASSNMPYDMVNFRVSQNSIWP